MKPSAPLNREHSVVWSILRDQYGYDFSGYVEETLVRRMDAFLAKESISSVPELARLLPTNAAVAQRLSEALTVNFTEMFRDPSVFRKLRDQVFPFLATYPTIRIWCAGCSTGEEPYSIAILLHKLGLLSRTTIYATDINAEVLSRAKEGVYSASLIRKYADNFRRTGILDEFSSYYHSNYNEVLLMEEIRKRVVFFEHNLLTDESPNEFHLILCRNVFIYFQPETQHKVASMFTNSLINLGYLCLGSGESLSFNPVRSRYSVVDKDARIYRRVDAPKL